MYKILLNPRWRRISLRVDLDQDLDQDQDRNTPGSDQDPIEDRTGIKVKKGTEALDEASVET